MRRVPLPSLALAALTVSQVLLVPTVLAWTPPPPEFPDVAATSGFDFTAHKWTPALGAPSRLLDVLPPGSPAAADYNRDGYPDAFAPSPRYVNATLNDLRATRSRLYVNDGSTRLEERFVDVTDVAGVDVAAFAYAAAWGDYDADGWPDLVVAGYRLARLYRNAGNGTFTDATVIARLPQAGIVIGAAWGDYDRDGRLDLFLARFAAEDVAVDADPNLHEVAGAANVLLRNAGGGVFEDATTEAGLAGVARRSTSAAFVDADADGDLDLHVTALGEPAEHWRNRGDGTFAEVASEAGLADGADATCQAWEDFDGDGRLDVYVAHEDGRADGLWLARVGGAFTDASALLAATARGTGWGCVAFDYDGDADADVFVAHGRLAGSMRETPLLLRNRLDEGAGLAFEDATAEAGDRDVPGYESYPTLADATAASGALALDWALLGTPGLLVTTSDGAPARVAKSVGWAGGWAGGSGDTFRVLLAGEGGRSAHGAVVTVAAGRISVTRAAGAGASWGAQAGTDLSFGLSKPEEGGYAGEAKPVSVTVRWPSGRVESYPHAFSSPKSVLLLEGVGYREDVVAPRPNLRLESGDRGENGWFTSASVRLRVTARDGFVGGSTATGVASVRVSLDGVAWTIVDRPTTTGVSLDFAGDGTHRLFVETVDKAGNRAVVLYPVRIDTTPPSANVVTPAPGTLHAEGREIARAPGIVGRAVVLAPARLGALGAIDAQPVAIAASDATSGVARVDVSLARSDGRVPSGFAATMTLPPFEWKWPADRGSAGEYRLIATVTDRAGHAVAVGHPVLLVPTGAGGAAATASDGPSPPVIPSTEGELP